MKHLHFQEISSTNDYVKEILSEEDEAIVTADIQTQGRGRNHRIWVGELGKNVYLSYGIKHKASKEIEDLIIYQAIGCLLALKTLKKFAPEIDFRLKYPNDILAKCFDGIYRKICGVLVEHTFQGNFCTASIIGIGVNIDQGKFDYDLSSIATSLKLLGINIDLLDFTNNLIDRFNYIYQRSTKNWFAEWKENLNIEGCSLSVIGNVDKWKVLSMENDGRLLVKNEYNNNQKYINDGDSIRYDFKK
jgi:BirA family biotin operon repressor/biotin-[acetyl-CoA-carboxylase] ligase